VKEIANSLQSGTVRVEHIASKEPSPLAKHILETYADIEELMDASISVPDQLEYMKKSVHARTVELSCMNCNQWSMKARIREVSDRPMCGNCGSGLLAYLRRDFNAPSFQALYNRLRNGESLVPEENDIVTNGRKTADMVLSYGRRAIEALAVHGVGPVTAYQVLSRMHNDDKTFYQDLLRAKIQYMRTRQYWDDRKERLK
jgi:ATP-dependent Lhr-like helicase